MSTKPLLLHAHAGGPNPIKIAAALEFLKVSYELKLWEFGDDPHKGVKGTDFLKINENGRVPALEDPNTGIVAWESGAIMNYLRRAYDKQNLLGPKESGEQAQVDFDKWEYFLVSTLGPMQGQLNWFKHYNAEKNDDAVKRYTAQTYRCFGVLEGQLAKTGGQSILPGGITAVDLHVEPWLASHKFGGLTLDNYPNLQKWLEHVSSLKEVKTAHEKIKQAGGH